MLKSTGAKQAILIGGALTSLLVGAGLSTGQEVLQYFVPYGWFTIGVGLISIAIIVIANYGYAYGGHHAHFKKGNEVFAYYCGPWIGRVIEWFTIFFCYCSYIVMVAGAGSTLEQQYGLPTIFGAIVMMALAGGTVAIGLNFLVDVVSRIGILLICLIFAVGIAATFLSADRIPEGMQRIEQIEEGKYTKAEIQNIVEKEASVKPDTPQSALKNMDEPAKMVKAASNWILSGFSYGGFCMLWLASFVATLGSQKVKYGPLLAGSVISALALVGMCWILGLAQVGNLFEVYNLQVPNLYLAKTVWPPMTHFYGVLTFLAIYSTACPLLWTVSSSLGTEGTPKYRIITVCLAIVGFAVAMFTPYNILINYIYVLNGYLGFFFLIIMVVRLVMFKISGPPAYNGPKSDDNADGSLDNMDWRGEKQ